VFTFFSAGMLPVSAVLQCYAHALFYRKIQLTYVCVCWLCVWLGVCPGWVWLYWCFCVCSYGAGGGGSGGSILMEACNVSGDGTVSAKGGASTARGSGAGGGGRVAIVSGFVSSELVSCQLCLCAGVCVP
jgi:hypothetical protein